MKKVVIALVLLLASAGNLMAQRFERHGFALGADRDTLLYIIASPFDNWWINVSAGVQTFIGNTPDSKASWNTADFGVRFEIGKWIIPDLAVSLRLGFASAHSQSRYGGNNPLVDVSDPFTYSGAKYGPYYPISASLATIMGYVTFDWTNFLHGYEAGRHRRWHFYTPVGLGLVTMIGNIENPNYVNKVNNNPNEENVELDELSRNRELSFSGSMVAEYFINEHITINGTLDLMLARGSLDDYNYNLDADERRVDLVPSLYLGMKFNLFKNITKYNPYTKTSHREKVNHEFLAYGTRNTIPNLNVKIEKLYSQLDSIENLAGDRTTGDSLRIDSLNRELNRLQDDVNALRRNPDNPVWGNIFDELLGVNEVLNLPATIVYYQLDKYDLDYNARKRLQDFAREAMQLDDTIEFYVIGAADSVTGSIRHNQWLSERRSEAAYNMLVNGYGMSGNQLIRVNIGGVMHYDPKENNRMALVIQRTPVTEEIVERWLHQRELRMKD